MKDTIYGTGDRGDLKNENDSGTPPEFVIPLPLRTYTPADLRKIEYKTLKCHDLPHKLPIDRGLELDNAKGTPLVWNVGDTPLPEDFPEQEAPFCPVELDPFLPWIHDVYATPDGVYVEFLAQNKRRCRTGKDYTDAVNRLIPQVTLLQPISVERLPSSINANELAPSLWHDPNDTTTSPRYRLADFDHTSKDGKYTRFICRFHAGDRVEETLSVYPFNYEMVSYRKMHSQRQRYKIILDVKSTLPLSYSSFHASGSGELNGSTRRWNTITLRRCCPHSHKCSLRINTYGGRACWSVTGAAKVRSSFEVGGKPFQW